MSHGLEPYPFRHIPGLMRHEGHTAEDDSKRHADDTAAAAADPGGGRAVGGDVGELVGGLVLAGGRRAVEGAVPAVAVEAVGAGVRDGGAGAGEAAAQHGAGHAGGPGGVDGAVALGGDVEAVGDDGVAQVGRVARREGRHVGLDVVRRVGDVDDQRGHGLGGRGQGEVGRVAPEEGRPVVQTQVDEGVVVRDGGEQRPVGHVAGAALVAGPQGRRVGPVVGRVGAAVHGEDDVNGADGLDQRRQGDVLQVLAAVHERQLRRVGAGVGGVPPAQEGVGHPLGDVVVVGSGEAHRQAHNRAAGTHHVASIVEALDAAAVVGDHAAREVGGQVLCRREAVHGRVEGAHLPGVDLVVGGVEADDGGAGGAAVGHEDGHGDGPADEVLVEGDGAEGVRGPAVGGVDELVRQRAAPVVGDGALEAGVGLGRDGVGHVVPVLDRVEDGQAALLRAHKDAPVELPHGRLLAAVAQVHDGAEVVAVDGPDEPAGAREPGHVRRRLQQAADAAGVGGAGGPVVGGGDEAGAVHQRAVATARHGDGDVGQGGGVVGQAVDVRRGVEARDVGPAQEVGHGLHCGGAALGEPLGLIVAQGCCAADGRACCRAVYDGRGVTTTWGVWECPGKIDEGPLGNGEGAGGGEDIIGRGGENEACDHLQGTTIVTDPYRPE
ncbi:hypothetical protein VSDG_06882 [Cytospora chrysosperma]|uniref:Uncharacterized protein n=1 Tax=Cytospora chrysosperma TaxID=252740 RepID=A0A423VQZ6_CYTCH|nr:hypothetical protein VSDG_06882 [Valsa sordida]